MINEPPFAPVLRYGNIVFDHTLLAGHGVTDAVTEPNGTGWRVNEVGVIVDGANVITIEICGVQAIIGYLITGEVTAPSDYSLLMRTRDNDALADQHLNIKPHTVPGFDPVRSSPCSPRRR